MQNMIQSKNLQEDYAIFILYYNIIFQKTDMNKTDDLFLSRDCIYVSVAINDNLKKVPIFTGSKDLVYVNKISFFCSLFVV